MIPSSTMFDGDMTFVLAGGAHEVEVGLVSVMAAEAVAAAIRDAVAH